MVLGIIGAFGGLFLPETLHQKLPDSMQEARDFGANQVEFITSQWFFFFLWVKEICFVFRQKFWSLPKAPKKKESDQTTDAELERLNATSWISNVHIFIDTQKPSTL